LQSNALDGLAPRSTCSLELETELRDALRDLCAAFLLDLTMEPLLIEGDRH
jgi:hypothetical protein